MSSSSNTVQDSQPASQSQPSDESCKQKADVYDPNKTKGIKRTRRCNNHGEYPDKWVCLKCKQEQKYHANGLCLTCYKGLEHGEREKYPLDKEFQKGVYVCIKCGKRSLYYERCRDCRPFRVEDEKFPPLPSSWNSVQDLHPANKFWRVAKDFEYIVGIRQIRGSKQSWKCVKCMEERENVGHGLCSSCRHDLRSNSYPDYQKYRDNWANWTNQLCICTVCHVKYLVDWITCIECENMPQNANLEELRSKNSIMLRSRNNPETSNAGTANANPEALRSTDNTMRQLQSGSETASVNQQALENTDSTTRQSQSGSETASVNPEALENANGAEHSSKKSEAEGGSEDGLQGGN